MTLESKPPRRLSGVDSDVQKILDAADQMKVSFKALEARRSLEWDEKKAVARAANQFRLFEGCHLAELRAAFDPEYAKELERMTKQAIKGE